MKFEIGNTYKIKSFNDDEIAGKLLTFGFLPETNFLFVRKSPFGGAYYFELNGTKMALRKEEAYAIVAEECF